MTNGGNASSLVKGSLIKVFPFVCGKSSKRILDDDFFIPFQ